ncbi:putative huntingtin interacting protein [Gorgonomyces haynaldii]|nr:putative huntingtin interacting protein [Gorgonomyces haynaldii]
MDIKSKERVTGPDGQVCENNQVLHEILQVYQHIATNVFRGGANGQIPGEAMLCECRYDQEQDEPWMACGSKSGCINRQLNIECPENQCPTGAFCLNQRFQLKQYASVEVFKTDKKGLGLRARSKITKNSFVMEYCGEVIPLQMLKKRAIEYAKNRAKHFYFMSLKPNEYIDASKRGNISRFMNHSCNPNCALQKWVVGAQVRVGMFAIKDIEKGEELTFDYKFERYGQEAQPCYCGEDNCKGFIGGDSKSELYDDDDFTDDEAEDPQVAPRSPVQVLDLMIESGCWTRKH